MFCDTLNSYPTGLIDVLGGVICCGLLVGLFVMSVVATNVSGSIVVGICFIGVSTITSFNAVRFMKQRNRSNVEHNAYPQLNEPLLNHQEQEDAESFRNISPTIDELC
jgi:predicted lipid-binding transport protein (Tim44 family)